MHWLKRTAPWLICLCLGATGAGLTHRTHAAAVGAPAPAEPGASISELAVARYQTACQGYDFAMNGHQPTDAPGADAIDWMRRRVKARLDIVEPRNDRVAFLKQYLAMLKSQEAFEEKMVKNHLSGAETLLRAQYDRIEAEMMVRQAESQ